MKLMYWFMTGSTIGDVIVYGLAGKLLPAAITAVIATAALCIGVMSRDKL